MATGVAGGLATPMAENSAEWCRRRLINGQGLLNHDLQKALRASFRQSMERLEKVWNASHQRDASRDGVDRDVVKALFREMREDAQGILGDAQIRRTVGTAEAIQLLDRTDPGMQATIHTYLTHYLDGHSEQLVAFLERNFTFELACCFGEELKSNDRAWRAFQRLVNDSLMDGVRSMYASQQAAQATLDTIVAQLGDIGDRLGQDAAVARDPIGEEALARTMVDARNEVISAVSEQFGMALTQVEEWYETTQDLIVSDGEQTRAAVASGFREARELHERTQQDIGRMEMDLRRLGVGVRRAEISERPIMVPYALNPYLVGRDEIVRTLMDELGGKTNVPRVAVLWGMNGVGKTQIAVRYSLSMFDQVQIIWWIHARSESTIHGDYHALAHKMGWPEAQMDDPWLRTDAIVGRLESTDQSWLLVVDDAMGQEVVRNLIPKSGNGRIVVTSTSSAWMQVTSCRIEVTPLRITDAAEFLMTRCSDDDYASAMALAVELGMLPVALSHAAAAMEAPATSMESLSMSIAGYLELFRRESMSLLNEPRQLADYHSTVAEAWATSLARVRERNQASADLLLFCAFLAPRRIPIDLLASQTGRLPEPLATALSEDDSTRRMIGALLATSLIQMDDETTISIHPLVHRSMRSGLDERAERAWIAATVDALAPAFPAELNSAADWMTGFRLRRHAQASVDHGKRVGLTSTSMIHLMGRLGDFLRKLGLEERSRELLTETLALAEDVHGRNHPDVATILHALALASPKGGEGDERRREALLQRALEINETAFGDDHPEVAESLCLLGLALVETDPPGGRMCLERALAINESMHGQEHPVVARNQCMLGTALFWENEPDRANSLYERAFEFYESRYDMQHVDAVSALLHLKEAKRISSMVSKTRLGSWRNANNPFSILERLTGGVHPYVLAKRHTYVPKRATTLFIRDEIRSHLEMVNAHALMFDHDERDYRIYLYRLGIFYERTGNTVRTKRYMEELIEQSYMCRYVSPTLVAYAFEKLGDILLEDGDPAGSKLRFEWSMRILMSINSREARIRRGEVADKLKVVAFQETGEGSLSTRVNAISQQVKTSDVGRWYRKYLKPIED